METTLVVFSLSTVVALTCKFIIKFLSTAEGTPLKSLKVGPQEPLQNLKVGPPHLSLMNSFFYRIFLRFFYLFIFVSFLNKWIYIVLKILFLKIYVL